MQIIGHSFHNNKPPWTIKTLAKNTHISEEALMIILPELLSSKLLTVTGENNQHYLPSQSLENITLEMIIDAARNAEETPNLGPDDVDSVPQVNETLQCMDKAISDAVKNKTLRDLV